MKAKHYSPHLPTAAIHARAAEKARRAADDARDEANRHAGGVIDVRACARAFVAASVAAAEARAAAVRTHNQQRQAERDRALLISAAVVAERAVEAAAKRGNATAESEAAIVAEDTSTACEAAEADVAACAQQAADARADAEAASDAAMRAFCWLDCIGGTAADAWGV